jgi:hypothetical protein
MASLRSFERITPAAALLACVAGAAHAELAVLEPVRDTSIYEESGSLSNGSGIFLFSGNNAVQSLRRALLVFDVAAALPPGAAITSVALDMTCTQSPLGDSTPQAFELHRLSASWGEAGSDAGEPGGAGAPADQGDATWTERFFGLGQPWTAVGGDFVAAPSATATVVGTCEIDAPKMLSFGTTAQLVADVQSWLADPRGNFGWVLVGNEGAPTTARRFLSREASAGRPTLQVEYVTTPGVPALGPWGAALAILAFLGVAALALRQKDRGLGPGEAAPGEPPPSAA